MSIFNNIKTDMYNAMKSGEKVKSTALRTALSKIKDKQIEKRDPLNDDEIIKGILISRGGKLVHPMYQKGD